MTNSDETPDFEVVPEGTVLRIGPPITADLGNGNSETISGDFVSIGDRLVPTYLELTFHGDADAPAIAARVEIRDGAPRLVELHLRSEPGQLELRPGADIRRFDLDRLFRRMAQFSNRVTLEPELKVEGFRDPGFVDGSIRMIRAARRNRRMSTELLEEVAAVYRADFAKAPTRAVADHFDVKLRRASDYVHECRERGLLPPTTKGKKRI
jgi:hypothetical protein